MPPRLELLSTIPIFSLAQLILSVTIRASRPFPWRARIRWFHALCVIAQLVGVNSTVKARGGGVRVASPSEWLGSLAVCAPRGASAGRLSLCGGGARVTGSVCGWDHACGVGRLIAVGGHWDTFALPSARLRACLRARLRALMRRLRAIGGSRSAVSRENKSRERT